MVLVRFHDDPAAFLEAAQAYLAAAPVISTVVAVSVGQLAADALGERVEQVTWPCWFATVHDAADTVVGVAMRTRPAPPHAAYILPMPGIAARALAAAIHDRGEDLPEISGMLPAARVWADELARLRGGEVAVTMLQRLHEVETVVAPPTPPGRRRLATPEDLPLVVQWFDAFHTDADAQAGRAAGHGPTLPVDEVRDWVVNGRIHLWESPDGRAVHMTGTSAPVLGVVRIRAVYTPANERGHGYAAATVAHVSRDLLAAGHRVCLLTDLDNPVSNAVYARLGFRPLADAAELELRPA